MGDSAPKRIKTRGILGTMNAENPTTKISKKKQVNHHKPRFKEKAEVR